MQRVMGLYALNSDAYGQIYGPEQRKAIELCMHQVAPPQTRQSLAAHPECLADAEVLITGWGAPLADEAFLAAAPRLKAIFYGAGAIGPWATEALWEREIIVTTASAANAVPVAEYSLGMILLGLKQALPLSRRQNERLGADIAHYVQGNFRRTVGLVSFGMVARKLRELLRTSDLNVIVYDPFLSRAEAATLGVERVGLNDLFERSEVVSVHTPLLPETVGLITGKQLSRMPQNAVFINTARGDIICQDELIAVAQERSDIQFVLDVTVPEPLPPTSPLHEMSNVLLTPHLAGSVGQECQRMGQYMVDELRRYVRGERLWWQVTPAIAGNSSHRPRRRAFGSQTAQV